MMQFNIPCGDGACINKLIPQESPLVPKPAALLLPLTALALIGCAQSPPNSAFVGNVNPRIDPLGLLMYEGQASSNEIGNQFHRPRQAVPDPLRLDGNYIGKSVLVINMGECPAGRDSVLAVGDNMLTYAYTPSDVFLVPIAPDGTFHGDTSRYTLDGSISKNRLSMTVAGDGCTSRFTGHSVLNKS
jgi:hypothetical protein